MIKQRKDSITQFEAGNRQDLADIEKAELALLAAYMPAGLSDEEVAAEVTPPWPHRAPPVRRTWAR
jgi:uncharacterized protein YqeY